MENRRRKTSSSGDKFSFPVTIPLAAEDSDQFEFGFVTAPGSPNSPADHLFYNGKLLPHVFPIQTTNNCNLSYSRSTSRTSSKDSLMSSRSNSTNSRSSNCSSARTSYSEASSERRISSADRNILPGRPSTGRKERNRPVLSSQYQWQLIAAAPVLKHQGSKARKVERNGSNKKSGEETKPSFGKRILKSFVSTCKECHAIKTSSAEGSSPRSLEL
ncbi:hypothetical protein CDL12_11633 [Handroanthus impetiginosus]|uniref:Uncharacterized protein n=1 Tax=Handroanthus impetiginosus TaxID=429701 RepID=A0A2G9HDX2_9LAMI|nr:hypothetical protein CDL12_11633 [Handroanthus impetiginosus]